MLARDTESVLSRVRSPGFLLVNVPMSKLLIGHRYQVLDLCRVTSRCNLYWSPREQECPDIPRHRHGLVTRHCTLYRVPAHNVGHLSVRCLVLTPCSHVLFLITNHHPRGWTRSSTCLMCTEDTTTPHGAILPDQASGTSPRIPVQSIQMNAERDGWLRCEGVTLCMLTPWPALHIPTALNILQSVSSGYLNTLQHIPSCSLI